MRVYARKAQNIVSGVSKEAFEANEEKQLALVRALEIIGEAAKSVPEDVRKLAPSVPWRQIIGTRDKLVHHYFGVDLDIIWNVAIGDLESLVTEIDELIEQVDWDRPG